MAESALNLPFRITGILRLWRPIMPADNSPLNRTPPPKTRQVTNAQTPSLPLSQQLPTLALLHASAPMLFGIEEYFMSDSNIPNDDSRPNDHERATKHAATNGPNAQKSTGPRTEAGNQAERFAPGIQTDFARRWVRFFKSRVRPHCGDTMRQSFSPRPPLPADDGFFFSNCSSTLTTRPHDASITFALRPAVPPRRGPHRGWLRFFE
jgi:hypothetical protein